MAEGDVRVVRGNPLAIELRNLGWVNGVVAWVQDNRFGVAFAEELHPFGDLVLGFLRFIAGVHGCLLM